MDLREILLTLVAPAGVGDELAPGVRLTGASSPIQGAADDRSPRSVFHQ